MDLKIYPGRLEGIVKAIPSKSDIHRALFCSALSNGVTHISPVEYSKDVNTTIDVIEKLGATVKRNLDGSLDVIGTSTIQVNQVFDCKDSGTTLRLLIPILSTQEKKFHIVGSSQLAKRPLTIYETMYQKLGLSFIKKDTTELDLEIEGKLLSGKYYVDGTISSQFISGLMIALTQIEGESEICIEKGFESKGYVQMTLDTIKEFGGRVYQKNASQFIVMGKQNFHSTQYTVEGDYSSVSFFLLANMLGSDVKISGLKRNSNQPDSVCFQKLREIQYQDDLWMDVSEFPDLGPVLFAYAATIPRKTVFYHLKRLRYKESDRVHAMAAILESMGIFVKEEIDTLTIVGSRDLIIRKPIPSYQDHRIVMVMSILGLVSKTGALIQNAECYQKSYPEFLEDFKKLGGCYELRE